jgi:hypothetical protein
LIFYNNYLTRELRRWKLFISVRGEERLRFHYLEDPIDDRVIFEKLGKEIRTICKNKEKSLD